MGKIRILHLEDDPNDSELVLHEFTEAGYQPEYTCVDRESDFISRLENDEFDIILADYNLPTYDGISALQYCSEKYPEIPFILVSGTLGEEIAVKMLKYGASDYLIKQNLKRLVPAAEHALKEAAVNREKLQTEKALLASEIKYRSIFENTRDVFFQIDQLDNISEISPSVKRLTGYTRDELIESDASVLFYEPEQKQELIKELEEIGEIRDFEFQIKTKDNKMKFISLNAHRIYDSEGNILGMEGSLHDIDERKHFEIELAEARDKAQESDRLKTAFINNISHEIRTPMNAIIGFSNLLKEPGNDREKQKYFIDVITQSSKHLLSIITDIMEISNIEARTMKLMPDQVNLNAAMDKLYKEHLPKTAVKGIDFRCKTSLPDEQSIILLDVVKLEAILNNLLTNAIKFTDEGDVNFGYILKNNVLEFFVSDTGIGISEDQHEKIFDRFYKVKSSSAKLYEGTGLGLAITKAYVELMGGTIQLSSKPGQGTIFRFSIPYMIPESDSFRMNSKTENDIIVTGPSKTILIAEDDNSNFELMSELLSGHDLRILHVTNGKDAIEICKSEPGIDLILMDLKMPLMDGYTATKKILEQNKNMKIIIQSAFATDFPKAMESGIVAFIAKPFDKRSFLSLVKKHLS